MNEMPSEVLKPYIHNSLENIYQFNCLHIEGMTASEVFARLSEPK